MQRGLAARWSIARAWVDHQDVRGGDDDLEVLQDHLAKGARQNAFQPLPGLALRARCSPQRDQASECKASPLGSCRGRLRP